MSISSLFQIGNSILNATSAGQVAVGKNIAGMADPSYHKINTTLVASGNGVEARFTRAYNQYTERSFVLEASSEHRFNTQSSLIKNLQNVVNESGEREGIGKTLTKFFASWSGLSSNPTNVGSKVDVIEVAKTLSQLIQSAESTFAKEQQDSTLKLQETVGKVNSIIGEIAQINTLLVNNINDDFSLLDKREALTRELATYVDISIVNSSNEGYTLTTKAGQTLVNGTEAYSLELHNNMVIKDLKPNSPYAGNIHFSGESPYEYTVEMINGGTIGGVPAPTFRVSIDGGVTWLTNPETGTNAFETSTTPVKVGDLEISFDAGTVLNGDSFTVIPKIGLFWKTTTSSLVNITPQLIASGTDNTSRLTGGSLAGLFSFRDSNAGVYREQLNTFTKELIWNVNRIYSQSAGVPFTNTSSSVAVKNTTVPIKDIGAGLPYGDKIEAGTFTMYTYDTAGNPTQHVIAIDPATDSLEDIAAQIEATTGLTSTANTDGTLSINAPAGTSFAFAEDTTGVLAGLGINTFFAGSGSSTIGVNPTLTQNASLLNTGKVTATGAIVVGSNSMALEIAELQNKAISIVDSMGNKSTVTLFEYYTGIAARVGADASSADFNASFYKAQAGFWYAKGQSEYGVSQDEELSLSMQLQDMYVAGTKLIDTARTMLNTLLSVV